MNDFLVKNKEIKVIDIKFNYHVDVDGDECNAALVLYKDKDNYD